MRNPADRHGSPRNGSVSESARTIGASTATSRGLHEHEASLGGKGWPTIARAGDGRTDLLERLLRTFSGKRSPLDTNHAPIRIRRPATPALDRRSME